MGKTNELGKFIAVVVCILGISAGTIFFLDKYWFNHNLTKKTTKPQSQIADQTTHQSFTATQTDTNSEPIITTEAENKKINPITEFYAVLKNGEYVARYFKDGTVKEISLYLTPSEVKSLLGNPDLEKYEDGESTNLVYVYGNLSIFFIEETDQIDFIIYESNNKILKEKWFLDLKHYQKAENADFYHSPSGYTSVKVDEIPQQKKAYIYLQRTYSTNNTVAQTNTTIEQQQAPNPKLNQTPSRQENGEYVIHAGEEIDIDTLTIKNNNPNFTIKYKMNVNYHFAFNNDNWVKVITDPKDTLELMAGEEGSVHIKVKASAHAPKAKYRYIVTVNDGFTPVRIKDFVVELK